MIHTKSLDNSIWKEEICSNIFFKIKVGKTFLRSKRKRIHFTLNTETEGVNRQLMYESVFNKAKLQFVRNTVIGCNGSKTLVMMDPYNSLKYYIHKYLVGSRGSFILVIDTQHEERFFLRNHFGGLSNNIVSDTTADTILNRIPFMFVTFYFLNFYLHIKYQVVLSTSGIFETIFIAYLQAILSQLSSNSFTTSFYQVQMILIILGTINVERKMMA